MLPGLSVSMELGLKLSVEQSNHNLSLSLMAALGLTAKGVKVAVWDAFCGARSRLVAVCFSGLESAPEGRPDADLVQAVRG